MRWTMPLLLLTGCVSITATRPDPLVGYSPVDTYISPNAPGARYVTPPMPRPPPEPSQWYQPSHYDPANCGTPDQPYPCSRRR